MTYKCVLATVCIPFFSFCLTLIFSTIQLHSLVKTSDSREIVLACQEEKIFWPGVLYVTQDRKKKKQEERNPIALCKSLNCSSAGRRRVFPLFFFFYWFFVFFSTKPENLCFFILYQCSPNKLFFVWDIHHSAILYRSQRTARHSICTRNRVSITDVIDSDASPTYISVRMQPLYVHTFTRALSRSCVTSLSSLTRNFLESDVK